MRFPSGDQACLGGPRCHGVSRLSPFPSMPIAKSARSRAFRLRANVIVFPSGETAAPSSQPQNPSPANGFRVKGRRPEPSTRMIQMPLVIGRGSRVKTIPRPVGVNDGSPWNPVGVSSRSREPSASIRATAARSSVGMIRSNAIDRPSGDHSAFCASVTPRVSCRGPVPSGRTVNSWALPPIFCEYSSTPFDCRPATPELALAAPTPRISPRSASFFDIAPASASTPLSGSRRAACTDRRRRSARA